MAYSFRKTESVSRAFLRIFREETASAMGQLRNSRNRAEAVHEARKTVKKLRALFALSGDLRQIEDTFFRDVGRKLSPLRDAEAVIEAFDDLSKEYPRLAESSFQSVRHNLERLAAETCRALNERQVMKDAADLFDEGRRRSHDWQLAAHDLGSLLPGFVAAYRRGRKALKNAASRGKPENFHELRKCVKQHWYQLKLIEPFWNQALKARARDVRAVETWLGDEHNITVLSEKLRVCVETASERAATQEFLQLSAKEAEHLRARSLETAQRLFAEKPKEFAAGFARYLATPKPIRRRPTTALAAPKANATVA